MTSEQWQQIKSIVQAALEIAPEERSRFVAERCGGDAFLSAEVESLLKSYEDAGEFIEMPIFAGKVSAGSGSEFSAGQKIGRYEIESLLGEGGMGAVYLAEDVQLRRKVAVKILPPALSLINERLRRFEQEARAASALNHPNIITIYEISTSGETHFIVTEFIEGETLHSLLEKQRLPLETVLDVAAQIASALNAAHASGIVHRDIKPENVMIRPDGLVKILDFGIAKLTENNAPPADGEKSGVKLKTTPGVIIGTANYMSPEQARGTEVDARSDVWSLGVVLYEMLGGALPFQGETPTDLLIAIVEREPPPLAKLATEEIPAALEECINRALRKNPAERYQSGGEMLSDLQRLRQKVEFESHFAHADRTGTIRRPTTTAGDPVRKFDKASLPKISSARWIKAFGIVALLLIAGVSALLLWRQNYGTNRAEIKSLAVLPLKSFDGREEYLGLGIADAVIRRISQTGKLIVRPTSSVRIYLNGDADALAAAKQLNVDAVLDGAIQRTDNRLRVTFNLLRTSDGVSLWAESFDLRSTDVFAVQDTVAQQVAARLELRLNPEQQTRLAKRQTSNAIAYEYYVKGTTSLDQRRFGKEARLQMEQTTSLFKRAVDADPNYALAHAQLAFCYAWIAVFVEADPQAAELARQALARAEELDPQLAETRLVRHMLLYSAYEGFQIEAAIDELLSAQRIDPNIGHLELAHLYQHIGLEDLADLEFERALTIDPTSEHLKNNIRGDYVIVNKYDEWLAVQEKFFDGQPDVWYYIGKGQLAEAEKKLGEEIAKNPERAWTLRQKALLLASKGDFAGAEAEIPAILDKQPVKNLQYHHTTYDIACVYALAGKSEQALKWLRETVATGFPSYPLFERDRFLDRIRQKPEFIEFMKEMKEKFENHKVRFR